MKRHAWLIIFTLLLAGCAMPAPRNAGNVCSIFHQYPRWYWATSKSAHRWGVPVSVQMAIIYEESGFKARAKPPHTRLLGIIPWFTRESSSYGYTQALAPTWIRYERATGRYGSRDSFESASDFVGWYSHLLHRKLGIPLSNAYSLYLAYHEGVNGYRSGTYLRKRWLQVVARKVEHRARVYQWQLNQCQDSIKKPHWWDAI